MLGKGSEERAARTESSTVWPSCGPARKDAKGPSKSGTFTTRYVVSAWFEAESREKEGGSMKAGLERRRVNACSGTEMYCSVGVKSRIGKTTASNHKRLTIPAPAESLENSVCVSWNIPEFLGKDGREEVTRATIDVGGIIGDLVG